MTEINHLFSTEDDAREYMLENWFPDDTETVGINDILMTEENTVQRERVRCLLGEVLDEHEFDYTPSKLAFAVPEYYWNANIILPKKQDCKLATTYHGLKHDAYDIMLFSGAWLETLSDEELKGVIVHELCHVVTHLDIGAHTEDDPMLKRRFNKHDAVISSSDIDSPESLRFLMDRPTIEDIDMPLTTDPKLHEQS